MATKKAESFAFQPTFGAGLATIESPETQGIIGSLDLPSSPRRWIFRPDGQG